MLSYIKEWSITMDIVITEWALDSYLNLKHANTFTDAEYKNTIRPDVELLKNEVAQHRIRTGSVTVSSSDSWRKIVFVPRLCVKSSDFVDKKEMAKLKNRIRDISKGHYTFRGSL